MSGPSNAVSSGRGKCSHGVRLREHCEKCAELFPPSPERFRRLMGLRRKAPMKRGTKRIPRINVERATRQREKYQAHLKSAHFRWVKGEVRKRSGGRCERIRPEVRGWDPERLESYVFLPAARCSRPAKVFNHTSYSKVPNEPPEHVEHVCEYCNAEYENDRSYRAAKRLRMRSMETGQ